jgi:hypothetical protein
MTLTLFGTDAPWRRLLNDEPIVSGQHPLHLYHGLLGAQAFRARGTLCCYDPAFQAGYPKTPVFDSGSRPAELFLTLAGGAYRPAAYKLGLALCCLLVPVPLLLAARGVGLGRGPAYLATAAGLLVWWGTPCRQLLEAGDLDFLLGGLAALAGTGLLVAYHRAPGFWSWTGLLASGCIGLFAQPLLVTVLFPLYLVYYLSVGAKHRLAWHVALFATLAGGLAANSFWLFDWVSYLWLRSPLRGDIPVLPHRTFHTLWAAPLWGDGLDRALAGILIGAASVGVGVLNQTNQRPAARLLGLGTLGFLPLAAAGLAWEPLGRIGTPRLLVPALWFAVVPAAHAIGQCLSLAGHLVGGRWRAAALAGILVATGGYLAGTSWRSSLNRYAATRPLRLGFTPDDQSLVAILAAQTTRDARILWEDEAGIEGASRWAVLLPLLTDRMYLGGLDPDGCIEHAYASLSGGNLAGRPLASWADSELEEFCRRYNVGWVVCRSPAAVARFGAWPAAKPGPTFAGQEPGCLYQLPTRSFALRGQARLVQADCQHITLADVTPEEGRVVLSLHYQAGLRASPSRVQVEKEPDPRDPIPFVRLRLQGPVARVTLTWQDH